MDLMASGERYRRSGYMLGLGVCFSDRGRCAISGDEFGKLGYQKTKAKGRRACLSVEKSVGTTASLDCVQIGKATDKSFWKRRVENCVFPKND